MFLHPSLHTGRFLSFLPAVVLTPVSVVRAIIPVDTPSGYLLKLGTFFLFPKKPLETLYIYKKLLVALPQFTYDKPHFVLHPNLWLLPSFQLLFPSSGGQNSCVLLCSD